MANEVVSKERADAVLASIRGGIKDVDWIAGSYVAMNQYGGWGVWIGVETWNNGKADVMASLPTSVDGVSVGFTTFSKRKPYVNAVKVL
jgi:hypothetical protein